MKKHYETHVEDTDKLISVAGPVLDYKSWYEQYRKLMEEQAQRKYGLYTPTSEGDDDFSSISGMIARYSALGLTNEQMAANPVWVDKMGNGHDIQLKNFSWKGMSGVGGYEMNFNLWRNNVSSIPDISMSTTTTSVSVSVGNSTYNNNLIYIHISNWDINKNHWLKVTSTYEDGDLAFIFYNDSNTKKIGLPANGYVNILAYPEFKGSYMYISTISNKQGSFTIEQLPLYPGALVFDGVDDYGVCENFPILTKEKGYTVVALRQWITYNPNAISAIATNASDQSFNGAFTFENYNKGAEQTISYGATQISLQYSKSPFSWQTTSKYNGVNIANRNKDATNSLVLGRSYPQRNDFANFAIWELVFLDHDATEEELTKIKDYFVKTYPWLFPDQAWTVTGKTNEDEDRATIANITGNGNNLVLSNFGFAEGSGYGLYVENYSNSRWFINNSITGTKKSDTFNVTSINQVAVQIQYIAELSQSPYTVPSYTIKVTGLTDGQTVNYRVSGGISYPITQDGIYILPGFDFAGMGSWYGFQFNKVQETCDITIEQIPEYEGYLVTDGVDDKITSSAFKMGKDWTVVGDWKFINDESKNAGIIKPSSLYVYNALNSVSIFINSGSIGNNIKENKGFNAICSNGRAYDRNWTEYSELKVEEVTKSNSELKIGASSNDTTYTRMAFKNFAIYPKVLSKDDCIKAYNYLQTLKSK